MAARNLQGRLRANSWNRSATVISKKEKKKPQNFTSTGESARQHGKKRFITAIRMATTGN
jgi:hypothetical protein